MWHWLKNYSLPGALKEQGVLGMNARNYKIISKTYKILVIALNEIIN